MPERTRSSIVSHAVPRIIHVTAAEFAATVYHLEFDAAVVLQSVVRGWLARRACADRVFHALREQALQAAARALREPVWTPPTDGPGPYQQELDQEQLDFDW